MWSRGARPFRVGRPAVAQFDSNAAGALGSFVSRPNLPLTAVAAGLAAAVCSLSFAGPPDRTPVAAGFPAGRIGHPGLWHEQQQRGAVLVSSVLPARPHALLPVLAYSLLQKLAAGRVTRRGLTSPALQTEQGP